MTKINKKYLEEQALRLNEENKKLEEEKEFRYFLILKKNREFKVVAIGKHKDPDIMLVRYNAPVLIELTIHEYFDYCYKFYGG